MQRSCCPDPARRHDAADPGAMGTERVTRADAADFGPFAGAEIDVVWPDLSGPLDDYAAALERGTRFPGGSAPARGAGGAGSTVAIVVDDPSRWTPVREALPVVLWRGYTRRAFAARMSRSAWGSAATRGRCRSDATASWRGDCGRLSLFQPTRRRSLSIRRPGQTPQGIPVRVFGRWRGPDLRIMIGSVLPHLQAGFGGGYKLIFPGTSHRTTLGRCIARELTGRQTRHGYSGGLPRVTRCGRRSTQPRRGWAVLVDQSSVGGRGQVFRIVAGHPERVQDLLADEAQRRLQAPEAAPADLVVAGNDPWPGDPMQSFKVLLHHRAASLSGGVLVGLFWTDPEEIDRSFPINALRRIAATGRWGGWTIRRLLPVAHASPELPDRRRRSCCTGRVSWWLTGRPGLCPTAIRANRAAAGPGAAFCRQDALWKAAGPSLSRHRSSSKRVRPVRIRVFPREGLPMFRAGQ